MPSGVYLRTEYHKNILKNTGCKTRYQKGSNHPLWKGGISFNKAKYLLNWRHNNGISIRYITKNGGVKIPKRFWRLRYKYNKKLAGKLSIKTIQLVYEDNIKKYGTLTCYLCLKPILFGKDHLEHKIPLSRGGTNEYSNLEIACQYCNMEKHNKTEEEYRRISK